MGAGIGAKALSLAGKLFGGTATSPAERAALQQALTAAGVTVPDLIARSLAGPALYNPRGLRRWKAAYDACLILPAYIHVYGDSIADGVGATGSGTANTDNVIADQRGWPGQLRARFAGRLGLPQAGLIAPRNGSTSDPDARVVRSGGASISTTGPMWAGWGISKNNGLGATGNPLTGGAPATLSFSLPRCTAFDILAYQSGASPLTGPFTYSVDGGAAITVNNTNAGYVAVPVAGLPDAPHTVTLTGAQDNNPAYLFGPRYHSGAGVCVARFARAGWTLLDSFGLGANANSFGNQGALDRLAASYGAWAPHLTIIGFLHNDWFTQLIQTPSGLYSTPETYETYLRIAVNRCIAAGGCALLLAPQMPPTQTLPGGRPLSDYHAVMRKIALDTDHCAHLNMNDRVGSTQEGINVGFYYDATTVHPSVKGHGMMAATLDAVLTRPDIVGLA